MADRTASASWQGDLFEGAGTVSAVTSGLFSDAGVTWASRTEAPGGKTSPEELLAAAHAACFCMALSNELSSRGHRPDRLEVQATCTFVPGKGITAMVLDVGAGVPDTTEDAFREALAAAEESCPVSAALRGNVDIQVDGALD
ncbi:MAG TPA: OsmC family peroxiredoxin [Acidimicrobiales bacterium]|jgi:osmotically inducible protein OsmC|nr:OsmC family peroxiredoxin [Acidimicrobiales bacterium]